MTDTSATTFKSSYKYGNLFMSALGFAFKPISFFTSPFFANNSFGSQTANPTAALNAQNQSQPNKTRATAALIHLNQTRRTVFDLAASNNWLLLSDLMQDWDQNRSAAIDGTRLARHALFAVADALASGPGVDGMPEISSKTTDRLEAIASAQPENYPLSAICAYLRICQAWNAREANDPIAAKHRDRALWLLAPHNAAALNAPLLAGVRFDILALQPTTTATAQQFYKEWAILDPEDQVPLAEYRFLQLSR